jgi:hypothetical protein
LAEVRPQESAGLRCADQGSVCLNGSAEEKTDIPRTLLVNINAESPRVNLEPVIVQRLVEHYQEKELGEDSNKSFATRETYATARFAAASFGY